MEDNNSNPEPWTFCPAITESWWYPDAFANETETITRALQISRSTDADYTDVLAAVASTGSPSPVVDPANRHDRGWFPRIVVDDRSLSTTASDAETAPRRTRNPALSPSAGNVSKRKQRPSKRSTTTFVAVDTANFRQMVQQVTGIPSGRTHAAAEAVLRPEPRRPGKRMAVEGSSPTTLDTLAFLLEHAGGRAAGWSAAPSPGLHASFGPGPRGFGFDIDP